MAACKICLARYTSYSAGYQVWVTYRKRSDLENVKSCLDLDVFSGELEICRQFDAIIDIS